MSAVVLIAVVGAVIGTVTTIALHSYLQKQLDRQLTDSVHHAQAPRPYDPRRAQGLDFVAMGASPWRRWGRGSGPTASPRTGPG